MIALYYIIVVIMLSLIVGAISRVATVLEQIRDHNKLFRPEGAVGDYEQDVALANVCLTWVPAVQESSPNLAETLLAVAERLQGGKA